MERFNMELKAINLSKPFTYCLNDSTILMRYQSFLRTYGQPEDIIVATVQGLYYIVKGELLVVAMLKNDIQEATVRSLGEVDNFELISARLFLNVRDTRLNYIDIAEAIATIVNNKHDAKRLSNETCIPVLEIERYKDLLTFDWEQFEKLSLDTGNVDLFGEKIEILDNYVTRKKYGNTHVDKLVKKKSNEKE